MKENNSILNKAEEFVKNIFEDKLPDWAVYHNLDHTVETVKGCKMIGAGSKCNYTEIELLIIAAWFHDAGYLIQPEDHEKISAELAAEFLEGENYPDDKKQKIVECILATKLGAKPKNLIESIICDADLISLGQTNYFELNDLLKLEIELRDGKEIDDLAWLKR